MVQLLYLTYHLLHGGVRFVTNVIDSPHLGIDRTIAERETQSCQP